MKRVLIAGYGKMGSWLYSMLGKNYECAVYEINTDAKDKNPHVLFLNSGVQITEFNPDIFVNCVDLKSTIPLFMEVISFLPDDCIVSDITSVKSGLRSYYSNCNHRYVSAHPMFGPTFTDMSNPVGRTAYVISESDNTGKNFFSKVFSDEGIKVVECTFDEHDKLMAMLLSVPVLNAILFAGAGFVEPHKGTTYERFHTLNGMVLSENPDLLNSLLANPYTLDVIAKMEAALSNTKESIIAAIPIDTIRLSNKLRAKEK